MAIKRLRIFAGPNGSGKTTIIENLRNEVPFGVYVNADDIEQQLKKSKIFLFSTYQLNVSEDELQSFFKKTLFLL